MVLVATIRALRHHGGATKDQYNIPNLDRVKEGFKNLENISRILENSTLSLLLLSIISFQIHFKK